MASRNSSLREDMAEVKTDVKWLKTTMSEHMVSHTRLKLAIYGGLISFITTLIILIIR